MKKYSRDGKKYQVGSGSVLFLAFIAAILILTVCLTFARSRPTPCTPGEGHECQVIIAAERLNDETLIQIFVSGVGTVALIITVYFSYLATTAATKAVEISSDLNEHTKRSSISELRPYVTREINYNDVVKDRHGSRIVSRKVAINWINLGKTPAYNIIMWSNVEIIAGNLPADFQFPNGVLDPGGTLGPGRSLRSSSREISLEDIFQVLSGRKRLHYWSRIEYTDIDAKKKYFTNHYSTHTYFNSDDPASDTLMSAAYIEDRFNDAG